MKTKWEYRFDTEDFQFDKEYKFIGELNSDDPNYLKDGYPANFEFKFIITPDVIKKNKQVSQTGKLYLIVPFKHEMAEKIVYHILYEIYNIITFKFGKFSIHGGLVMGEHIPETDEEKDAMGDNKYFAHLKLEKVDDDPVFNVDVFQSDMEKNLDIQLMSQYNQAMRAEHVINKFVGYFKILEDTYSRTSIGKNIKEKLKNNDLFELYKQIVDNKFRKYKHFEAFVDSIVDARHKCSHLKNNKKFGYLPDDARLKVEVKPYINILANLAYSIINKTRK